MQTYVSILNWSGCPQPTISETRRAIDERTGALRARGMHSIAFLPDEGACFAIMVSSCPNEDAVERLAASILPGADVNVETMPFEAEVREPANVAREYAPPPPRDYRRALLEAISEN